MEVDIWALLVALATAVVVAGYLYLSKPSAKPHLLFSSLAGVASKSISWRLWCRDLPKILLWTALAALLLAFVDPHRFIPQNSANGGQEQAGGQGQAPNEPPSTEGAAIYLILDQSGSMEETVPVSSSWGVPENLPKLTLLKQIAQKFIVDHPKDLIGMISFARTPQVLVPLTLDHATLLQQLANLDIMRIKDQDGTGIGYAVFKAVNIIAATKHFAEERAKEGKATYAITKATIVLITDGLQDTNPLDAGSQWRTIGVEDAGKEAAHYGVRLYVINIEPKLATAEFAPQRREIEKATSATGGKFYMVEHPENLGSIYREIDTLEKVKIPKTGNREHGPGVPPIRISYSVPLILIALIALMLALAAEALWIKGLP